MTAPAWVGRFARKQDVAPIVAPHPDIPDLNDAERERTAALIRSLALRGYRLNLEGDDIAIDTDKEIPPDLIERLAERKPAILTILKAQALALEAMRSSPVAAAETRTIAIDSPWGRVWIVPESTGLDRLEATWAELHRNPQGTLTHLQAIGDAMEVFKGKLMVKGAKR